MDIQRDAIPIKVKLLSGRKVYMEVFPNHTVYSIRKKLA
jgi:hypothetical protein